MHRILHAGFVASLGMLMAVSGGCGSGGSSTPTSGPEVFQHASLQEVGDLYRTCIVDAKKPPTKLADLAKYEIGLPSGYQELKNGNIVVFWGAPVSDSASDIILAHEKATPTSGGYVLMQDGLTIKKMTAEEFKSAPKAGGN
jgi:hypothetical protein